MESIESEPKLPVERVQLGVRMEKRLVKVLKGLAEHQDVTLGQLLEDIILHAFEGASTFSSPEALRVVQDLKAIYRLDYDTHASYRFQETA